jgi:hypothetical protein
VFLGAAYAVKQRQVVLDGRMRRGQQCLAPFLRSGSRGRVVGIDRRFHLAIEFDRPVVCAAGILPIAAAQVVHDISASQNQNSALAQRPNFAPQLQVLFETAPPIETELKCGHGGFWIHVAENAPGAMIEPPTVHRARSRERESTDRPQPGRPAQGIALHTEAAGSRRSREWSAGAPRSSCEPSVTQCGETTQTAFGFSRSALNALRASVNAFCSIALIGDPWPTNTTGIFSTQPAFSTKAGPRNVYFVDQLDRGKDSHPNYSRSDFSGL